MSPSGLALIVQAFYQVHTEIDIENKSMLYRCNLATKDLMELCAF